MVRFRRRKRDIEKKRRLWPEVTKHDCVRLDNPDFSVYNPWIEEFDLDDPRDLQLALIVDLLNQSRSVGWRVSMESRIRGRRKVRILLVDEEMDFPTREDVKKYVVSEWGGGTYVVTCDKRPQLVLRRYEFRGPRTHPSEVHQGRLEEARKRAEDRKRDEILARLLDRMEERDTAGSDRGIGLSSETMRMLLDRMERKDR